jgi:hypothetical protein
MMMIFLHHQSSPASITISVCAACRSFVAASNNEQTLKKFEDTHKCFNRNSADHSGQGQHIALIGTA